MADDVAHVVNHIKLIKISSAASMSVCLRRLFARWFARPVLAGCKMRVAGLQIEIDFLLLTGACTQQTAFISYSSRSRSSRQTDRVTNAGRHRWPPLASSAGNFLPFCGSVVHCWPATSNKDNWIEKKTKKRNTTAATRWHSDRSEPTRRDSQQKLRLLPTKLGPFSFRRLHFALLKLLALPKLKT